MVKNYDDNDNPRTLYPDRTGDLSSATDTGRILSAVRPSIRRRRVAVAVLLFSLVAVLVAGLTAARAVLFPRVDSPEGVDAIVVVAGAQDDRYVYARHLAEEGMADHILVSQPPGATGSYATALDSYCAATPVTARDGRQIDVECFAPTSTPPRARPLPRPASHGSTATSRYWW